MPAARSPATLVTESRYRLFANATRASAALAACAALLAGCAHVTPPERGGPPWIRLTSEHFRLVTDLPSPRAAAELDGLEQTRAALLAGGFPGWPSPAGRSELIVLRTRAELAEFGGWLEAFGAGDGAGGLAFVLHGEDDVERVRVLQYELSVGLTLSLLRRLPFWLATGLGTYLETARIDTARQLVITGEPTRELLAGAGHQRPGIRFNGWSTTPVAQNTRPWETVHFLLTERNAAFAGYLERLGRGEPPGAAFDALFPDLAGDRLTAAVVDYSRTILHSGRVKVATSPLPKRWAGATTAEPLSPAEVHALFARLYRFSSWAAHSQALRARADAEVAEALRLDPDQLDALLLGPLDALPPPARKARLEALVRLSAADHRVRLRLALEAAPGSLERIDALRNAAELDRDRPEALAALAQELLWLDPAEALEAAERGQRLEPWRADLLAILASAQASSGRCADAAKTRAAALDRVGPAGEALPADLAVPLAVVEKACKL